MRRYLVVANQTLAGEHLLSKVRELSRRGPSAFHILVPATPPRDHPWTEGEARGTAKARLDMALARFHDLGVEATGEVGDGNPMLAIQDMLREREFDEIVLSTLPPGLSKWLKLDLPHRVETAFDLPVTHVVGQPERVASP